MLALVQTKDLMKLPVVLARDEVRKILDQVRERRFAVPLRLTYLCGLRLSECLHLEVKGSSRNLVVENTRRHRGCNWGSPPAGLRVEAFPSAPLRARRNPA